MKGGVKADKDREMDAAEVLALEAIRQVPRAIGLADRDPAGRTYGCADRYFWHYKFHDFPNARFQETSELFARAFLFRHPSNPFAGKEHVRDWAIAAVRFWERMARSDGSFDEAYPYERSFCATAFSAMHAVKTLLLLSEKPSSNLRTVGQWLAFHDSPDTANQRSASAAALALIGVIEGSDMFGRSAGRRAAALWEEQTRLGYFNEYGGKDIGYTSITLSALAVYAAASGDAESAARIKSAVTELSTSIRPDGRYDYGDQSRATRFLYPFALARAGDAALSNVARGVTEDSILKPSWMDDRYMIPFAVDYLRCVGP